MREPQGCLRSWMPDRLRHLPSWGEQLTRSSGDLLPGPLQYMKRPDSHPRGLSDYSLVKEHASPIRPTTANVRENSRSQRRDFISLTFCSRQGRRNTIVATESVNRLSRKFFPQQTIAETRSSLLLIVTVLQTQRAADISCSPQFKHRSRYQPKV